MVVKVTRCRVQYIFTTLWDYTVHKIIQNTGWWPSLLQGSSGKGCETGVALGVEFFSSWAHQEAIAHLNLFTPITILSAINQCPSMLPEVYSVLSEALLWCWWHMLFLDSKMTDQSYPTQKPLAFYTWGWDSRLSDNDVQKLSFFIRISQKGDGP